MFYLFVVFFISSNVYLFQLTWGDFVFTGVYDYLKKMLQMPDLDTKYPAFKELTDNVLTQPKVKEYTVKAPICDV